MLAIAPLAGWGAASAPYAALPLLREHAELGSSIAARIVIVLLALMVPLAWWLRRRAKQGPGGLLRLGLASNPRRDEAPKICSVTRVNGAIKLYVVEWEAQRLLLSCAGTAMTVLSAVPAAPTSSDGTRTAAHDAERGTGPST